MEPLLAFGRMRMRQSIAEIEDAFFEEIEEDRERRERLRRRAERRQLERQRERAPPARLDALRRCSCSCCSAPRSS